MIDKDTGVYIRRMGAIAADACLVHRVVAVHQKNPDGTRRQKYIARCKPLDSLGLSRCPTAADPEAIGVINRRGRQLGYLDRRQAIEIAEAIASGIRFEVVVAAVWRDPGAGFCLVIAIFQLKAGYGSLRQAEALDPIAASLRRGGGLRRMLGSMFSGSAKPLEPSGSHKAGTR